MDPAYRIWCHALEENRMKPFRRLTRRATFRRPLLVAVAAVAAVAFAFAAAPPADGEAAPIFVSKVPDGYRDWKLISVAREEGDLDDIRAILGNDVAIRAYREGKLPFPDGAIVARLAWSFDASDENNNTFARLLNRPVVRQSFVAGSPKNGVQFMVKDSKKYASTGGWSYGHFDDGKSADDKVLNTCYPCHAAIQARDFVFTRYAP
jgi:hypothetical protein